MPKKSKKEEKKKKEDKKKGKRGKKAKNSIVVKNNAGPNIKQKKNILLNPISYAARRVPGHVSFNKPTI